MKLIIETVYENITEEWFEWWLSRFPKDDESALALRDGDTYVQYSSKDPTSNVFATTTYRIERGDI